MKKTILVLTAILLVMSLSCRRSPGMIVLERGHFYMDPAANLRTIGKVVVVEFDNRSTNPQISAEATEAITEALQKRHLFAVRTLHPSDAEWQSLDLENIESFDTEQLVATRDHLNADAIIFGSLTQYYPYPHLLMGLNMKMVDLKRARTIWAMEQIWDSTDKSTELRVKQYAKEQVRSEYNRMDWQMVITSPRAFNRFIAFEVAQSFSGGVPLTGLRASTTGSKRRSRLR